MPEGPEVAITAQYLLGKLKGRMITKVEVLSGPYARNSIPGIELMTLKTKISDIDSKGKVMWFTLEKLNNNKEIYLINNFGLTGDWSFKKNDYSRIKFIIENINNDKTYNLYYNDKLSYGKIVVTDNKIALNKKLDELAPDYLKDDFSDDEFVDRFKKFLGKTSDKKYRSRKNIPIVKLLMGQTIKDGVGSGIGNYLAAEILYRAKIDPNRSLSSLSDDELIMIAKSIKYIIKLSYYYNTTGYMVTFGSYIDEHKKLIDDNKLPEYHSEIKLKKTDKFSFSVYNQKMDPLGNDISKDRTINKNRTTFWVKNIQK